MTSTPAGRPVVVDNHCHQGVTCRRWYRAAANVTESTSHTPLRETGNAVADDAPKLRPVTVDPKRSSDPHGLGELCPSTARRSINPKSVRSPTARRTRVTITHRFGTRRTDDMKETDMGTIRSGTPISEWGPLSNGMEPTDPHRRLFKKPRKVRGRPVVKSGGGGRRGAIGTSMQGREGGRS